MEIKFLGTGGAFEPELGNSAAIVKCQGSSFLIDCGFTVYAKLKDLNLFNEIDYVLITHLHNDHTGSLTNVLLHHYLISNPGKKLKVIYPSKKFRKQLRRFLSFALVETDNYVDWVPLKKMKDIIAIDTYGKHVPDYQTYGYIFREGEDAIVYSGDIGDEDYIFRELKKKKIRQAKVFHEIIFENIPGHSCYSNLIKHQQDFPIYGYHCNPIKNRADNTIPLVQENAEFLFSR